MHPSNQQGEPLGPVAPTSTAHGVQQPLSHTAVRLNHQGWLGEWQSRNAARTLPHVLGQLEDGEAKGNLARLIEADSSEFSGMFFTDTDVYKTLEAIAWSAHSDLITPDLLERAGDLVDLLAKVQEDDGYLNSYVQGTDVARWSDPQWAHELYTAGHLFQAAVAAARADVFPQLVAVAERFAQLIVQTHGSPQSPYIDGHPQIETALVELYRLTGNADYLEFARQQIERRGHGWLGPDRFGSPYFQDHEPLRSVDHATGHAVRQLYLLTGAVDVAVETGDLELLAAVERVWHDLFTTKTYISGAHGSRHRDEAIGDAYELPPDRAYAETCAAIASFMLNWRLLLATGRSAYADEMEIALYNAIAVSTSIAGTEFFYSNPLQLRTGHYGAHEDAPSQRLPWFSCACCPPNIGRLLASAHDYLFSTSESSLTVHHYTACDVDTAVAGRPFRLSIKTEYPYEGKVKIAVTTQGDVALRLRVPRWSDRPVVSVAGAPVQPVEVRDGYLTLRRTWSGTTDVELLLDLPVRTIRPHPHIDALRGTTAIMRGPVLYAVEQADLPDGISLDDLVLQAVGPVIESTEAALAPMAVALQCAVDDRNSQPDAPLYQTGTTAVGEDSLRQIEIAALPYHRWANRTVGPMRVWLPATESRV